VRCECWTRRKRSVGLLDLFLLSSFSSSQHSVLLKKMASLETPLPSSSLEQAPIPKVQVESLSPGISAIPTRQSTRDIQNQLTQVLCQSFADRILVLVTQVGKIGCLVSDSVNPFGIKSEFCIERHSFSTFPFTPTSFLLPLLLLTYFPLFLASPLDPGDSPTLNRPTTNFRNFIFRR